ncbi:MAG: AAA family ATPase, partial [Pseudomonadota bacterium]
MRLAELALLAYGALRDEVLRFPAGRPDLHLVYGPNAAGKSTARQAINDALFGFPERSPMGFAVDPRELRIGFEVERAGRTLAAIRRKGRKKTLLGPDGEQPADEALLEAWVGHIGRARFERAFALDDTQLRAGGEAIAEGGDDLAGLLFAASSGLARLSRALDRLEADADAAWGITRKASRRAQTAFDHFRAADEQLKAARLLTAAYRRKRDRLQQLEREREAVRGQRRALKAAAEQAALALRVLEPLGRFHRARTALGEVADVARLPEGAVVAIDGITARLAVNAQAVTTLEARAAELRREFDALPAHEPLLDLDEAIDAFGDRVAVVGEALARREVEVETRRRAEADARTVLADLGRCPAFTDARAVLAGLPNS